MAGLALVWLLQRTGVAAAIVVASRPEQLVDNVTASGVRLEPDVLAEIDSVLANVVEREPTKIESFLRRP